MHIGARFLAKNEAHPNGMRSKPKASEGQQSHCHHMRRRDLLLLRVEVGLDSEVTSKCFLGGLVVLLRTVELGDLCHLFIGELEIEDVSVISDVGGILGTRDDRCTHLHMPAKNDLGRRLTVLLGKLDEDRPSCRPLSPWPSGYQASITIPYWLRYSRRSDWAKYGWHSTVTSCGLISA